ncbi:MAG: hypothetical protein DI533_07165 [Cereibacter sphaeroides]|uniref:Peptidoglycan-binding protein n=1 Tax=Cereibacter sphaeroides TaxID=1063 RepID=A0A2W5TW65_CERSP|nr:MAG: hypothetical protein DI533_07165 [Cereibacter sphaeroides]
MSAQVRQGSLSTLLGVNRFQVNARLTGARNCTNLALIGAPRGSFDTHARDPQNPDFMEFIETTDLMGQRITGLRPAIGVLRTILKDIATRFPHDPPRFGISQMLACRMARGAPVSISNHSWGLAVDLTIDGSADPWAVHDGLEVLRRIYPIFRRHGFCWGAAFPIVEPMHFEASDQLVRRWAAAGLFSPRPRLSPPIGLTIGDRGSAVLSLQQMLNARLPIQLDEDGAFGIGTRAAVIEFQTRQGMRADGIAARPVLRALDLV